MRCITVCVAVVFMLCGVLGAQTNLLPNGNLETWAPNFWHPLNASQGTVTWATDETAPTTDANANMRSFKVEKTAATTDAVGWQSENNADLYWNNAAGNVLYSFSFMAKTMGVNTSPANNDAAIGVWYRFYVGGGLIGEQFVGVDQSTASVDWTEYTGQLLVTSEPDEVFMTLQMGKDATGTVWFDNIGCGTDPWSMGPFNGDAETPESWLYWTSGGDTGFANMVLDTGAHSGNYSAMVQELDNNGDELVFYSEPISAQPDKWYKISVWAKSDNVNTDTLAYATNITDFDENRLGVCFFFHRDPLYESWELTGGDQFYYFDQRNPQQDWTQYIVLSKAPSDAAGVSMRARFNPYPTGTVYYDDFMIQNMGDMVTIIEEEETSITTLIPSDFVLKQNYPNPFNPETIIEYRVPEQGQVVLSIYNALGQKIRTLVNDVKAPGTYQVYWDGTTDSGAKVATGVYIYQLRGQNALITKKMLLIK